MIDEKKSCIVFVGGFFYSVNGCQLSSPMRCTSFKTGICITITNIISKPLGCVEMCANGTLQG